MAKYKGLDVSEFQGNIDFVKVKAAGYKFVIIRAGYGRYATQVDKYFEQNYKKAKAAGLAVGAYWFSYATSVAEAKEEAKVCMQVIKGKQFEYPIFFDIETDDAFRKGKTVCSAMVEAFCDALEKSKWFAGFYISRSPLQTYITPAVANRYALWVAEYGSSCQYDGTYGMWQYSSKGKINGISGNVDLDYSYNDYATIIKKAGYNGFKKPVLKTLDEEGYVKGDATIGVYAYKQLLMTAKAKGLIKQGVNDDNVFGGGTEKATNELLKHFGYKQNGIAGSNLIGMLGSALRK